jgi:hypothetical protein
VSTALIDDLIITQNYESWNSDMGELSKRMDYLAFLLRLWREEGAGSWRASLVDPHSGERQAFADLGKLFKFIQDRTTGNESQEETG